LLLFDNRSFYLHFDSFFGGFLLSALVDRSPSRVQLQEAQDKKTKKMANHEDGMTKVCPAIQSKSGVTRKGRESGRVSVLHQAIGRPPRVCSAAGGFCLT
jgi:hypothetical protein